MKAQEAAIAVVFTLVYSTMGYVTDTVRNITSVNPTSLLYDVTYID